jgi:hypothetical protein
MLLCKKQVLLCLQRHYVLYDITLLLLISFDPAWQKNVLIAFH